MEEPPRTPSSRQVRTSRANKLLSQFKGIIKARKTNDDGELGGYPYASQTDSMDTNAVMKPYMSQPHLGLQQVSGNRQRDSEFKFSKRSGSSERSPARLGEDAQPAKSSVNQDFPLRTSPGSPRNSRKTDASRSPPSPRPRSTREQSLGTVGSINSGNGRNVDGLPVLMDPTKALTAVSGMPTPATSPQTFPAQPPNKRPVAAGGSRRPSTAQASLSTTGSASASPRPGPLLKLKRSFSQLRLNSLSKQQQPDVPSPNTPHSVPSTLDSTSVASALTGSQSPSSSPPIPTRPSETPETLLTASSSTSPTPVARPNTSTIATISTQPHNTMAASGAFAPMSAHPKPLPPVMNLHIRTPSQPPKLSLPPVNHRISFTIPTEMGYARLSPTIITRPTPLPLLNLPTLPPKTGSFGVASVHGAGPSGGPSGTGLTTPGASGVGGRSSEKTDKRAKKATRAQLNSMPALPLQGAGRGVGGREEVDDREDDDEEEDDGEDDTGDEEEGISRLNSSGSDFLGSDMSEDSVIDAWASQGESSRFDHFGHDYYSHSRSEGKEMQWSPSSGSSYHSALHEPSSHIPELMGMRAVPLLKQPTPPSTRIHALGSASSQIQKQTQSFQASSTGLISSTPTPNQNHSVAAAKGHLPEVDTSRFNLPIFPRGPTTSSAVASASPSFVTQPVVDVKGKGKARDCSTSIFIGGGEHYDPAKTPTGTSHSASFRGGGGGATTTQAQGSIIVKPKSPVAQSPTGTLRQQHAGGGGDYFSAKGSTAAVPSISAIAIATTSTATSQHPGRPYSYSSHSSARYSTSFTPTSQATTPRPGMGGIRTSFIMPGMPTPKRSSTLMLSPDGGAGGGGGNGQFVMPKMYKRASQSLIDLHTIEAKEKRRIMEEEARAEEDEELARMREKEKEREKEKKEKQRERERRMEDEKIKEDDDEEAAERRDYLAPPISPITAHAPVSSPAAAPATKHNNRLSRTSIYMRRRRSMPMFDESSEPPPYPSFAPHHPKYKVMPREDEGREKLPAYVNPIYLKAIMPRKMEFSAPGTQARDRKWRRVLCVLEGTVFRVYKCPPGHAGVGVLGEWWEKQVGAGDVSLQPSHAGTVPTIQIETRESRRLAEERRDFERQVQRIMKAEGRDGSGLLDDEEDRDLVIVPTPGTMPSMVVQGDEGIHPPHSPPLPPTPSSSRSRFASFLKPGRNHMRSKSDVHFSDRTAPSPSPRPSLNIPRSGISTPARSPSPYSVSMRSQTPMSTSSQSGLMESTSPTTGRATPMSSSYSSIHGVSQQQPQQQSITGGQSTQQYLYTNRERDFVPDAGSEDLIRAYSMQRAESGLGNDYTKRKNVIRVRLEGEQFLLQARDVTGVVEWIEALQAATNISLDLDERPMPRGPLFPRRRRRRRPVIAGAVSEGGPADASIGGRAVTATQ